MNLMNLMKFQRNKDSTINQVIGGANVLTITDSSTTEELDIVSEKGTSDDINTHETFSSVNVHPFAGSAVEFSNQATFAGQCFSFIFCKTNCGSQNTVFT